MAKASAVLATAVALIAGGARAQTDPAFADIVHQQAAILAGAKSAEGLTRAYLARIAALDRRGPRLNSVLAINPTAIDQARTLDARRRAGQPPGSLDGVVILIKDNIDTRDAVPTTAGSLALKDNITGRDAPLVARLRDAGAVILGKTNLSEWANFRSNASISGWSAAGGLTRNPYALDRGPCGSSAGSAVAVAAGLASAAIGTETDGSITCPAAVNGLVGLKPTVGLVPRSFIVPISQSQDTAGPLARTVADAAALLTVIAGSDPRDPATAEADRHKRDYRAALDAGSLKGVRLGVLAAPAGRRDPANRAFAHALTVLQAQGAVLVPVSAPDMTLIEADEEVVLNTEFKAGVNAYLASAAKAVKTRTLADLIAFNAAEPREMALFGQDVFEAAEATHGLEDPAYLKARSEARRLAGPEGIDRLLREADVQALVALSGAPASVVDPVNGSAWLGSPSTLPAVAGYPHLTVPMDQVYGLPVGLSFIGPAWSEARLLAFGYAFEQSAHAWRPPTFRATINTQAPMAAVFDP